MWNPKKWLCVDAKNAEVNCVSTFHINLSNCSGLLKYKHWGKKFYTTLIASETLNLGNFMHAEVDFIFPSSAKITIKPNLVYLFNETQDPCPDGFNQSPRYVVIRGSLPWFCFYLTFRMCSQFKFREILATKCCLIYMRIIRRGPLNVHSRYRNAAPFSTFSFREQRSPGKCYLLSGTNSFHSGDVTSPLISRTHEDSEAGGGSEPRFACVPMDAALLIQESIPEIRFGLCICHRRALY